MKLKTSGNQSLLPRAATEPVRTVQNSGASKNSEDAKLLPIPASPCYEGENGQPEKDLLRLDSSENDELP
eukprot:1391889-Amorphochlora_amoeboformis.AAC.1